jgi:hypothetical protein
MHNVVKLPSPKSSQTHPFLRTQLYILFFPSRPLCLAWIILYVWPSTGAEHGWLIGRNTLRESWPVLSQKLTTAGSFFAKGRTLRPAPLSVLGLGLTWTCTVLVRRVVSSLCSCLAMPRIQYFLVSHPRSPWLLHSLYPVFWKDPKPLRRWWKYVCSDEEVMFCSLFFSVPWPSLVKRKMPCHGIIWQRTSKDDVEFILCCLLPIYCWTWWRPLRLVCFPNETPLEKNNFNLQVVINWRLLWG